MVDCNLLSGWEEAMRAVGKCSRRLLTGPTAMNILRAAVLLHGLLGFSSFACAQVSLAVRITDQDTGSALEYVRVEVVLFPNSIVHMDFTNSSGTVEFLNVKKLQYVLRATKDGYQPYQETIDLSAQITSATVPVRMQKTPAKAEPAGGVVSARVLAIPEPARKEFKTGLDMMGDRNDPEGSIGHFQKAIDAFPNYYEAYYTLGMAQLKIGDASGGEASLRKAIEIHPRFLDPYYPLSELLIRQQHFDEAEILLLTPFQEDQESWQWPYELGMCYGKMSQWDKGITMTRLALGRKNAPTKIRLLLADLYSNMGETSKAIAELETFLIEDPESPMTTRVNEVLKQLRQ
jgi:tetratricopeptide (TPR) repeat protein